MLGGNSKCHICEDILCSGEGGKCYLQLQGIDRNAMSFNIPTVSDTAWAIKGSYKRDFGGSSVSHFCVFTSGGECILPSTTDFSHCSIRCFGAGFQKPAIKQIASARSHVDVYPGMGRWPDDGQVDLWAYPNNCSQLLLQTGVSCTYSGPLSKIPSFNPQGYTFTLSGSGLQGFTDGSPSEATFNGPEDLSVNENGIIYVADTQNNAIRAIDALGNVKTLAGKGPNFSGFADGPCSQATFKLPKGIDVRQQMINNLITTVILVADTGNHRIRRIDYVESTQACTVRCLTGLCGNNSLSASDFKFKATPLTGYADGLGTEARFSAPESVTFMDGNYFVIADTGNFLLRWAFVDNGTTFTLAGTVVPGQKDANGNPQAGCTPPCLQGLQGFRDGNLSFSQFYNPLDVTRGPNNTVWVADEQRIRIVELPLVITDIFTIKSTARVSTIAGVSLQGNDDGYGDESKFFYSSGVFVTEDSVAYVVDAVSCRVRRISPLSSVAEPVQCSTIATDLVRPSGCTSFDQPIDKIGRKVSRVEANVQYNYDSPYLADLDRGKYIKNCVGVPPPDTLDKHFITQGDNLVVDDYRKTINEDSEQGTAILISCPASCQLSGSIAGNHWYSEDSNVCLAAIHDGKISTIGGLIQIIIQRRDYLNQTSSYVQGTTQHGISSTVIPQSVSRVFSIKRYNVSKVMVHTIAGHPSAPLESACSFKDAQPPSLAHFNNPSGISASYTKITSDSSYIFVADTYNNRIRAISAVCTQICENGGTCIGNDLCHCPSGWSGIDCSKPQCSTGLCNKSNFVCVGPETCACKPGFQGNNCDQPQCVQKCLNGGTCTAPDTCTCQPGWFDPSCATPVCSQTCANGGNCTAPNACACPTDWQGIDCRTPVCEQTCKNKGICIAPNTCSCPPQWSNYDCSAPVCDQGYFVANQGQNEGRGANINSISLVAVPTYKNCDLQSWCNATHEFECDQTQMTRTTINVPSGPKFRHITGRKVPPTACMSIELPISYKIPFQLLLSDNTTTGYVRFSPNSPYTSNDANLWRGYLFPTDGHTGPWVYTPDRQVLNVNWLNVSQGLYVCANEGSCVSPGVCACATGWAGFDCRTPICSQGYYNPTQPKYVSGLETSEEVKIFGPFLGNNSYRLQWPYSNPNYTMEYEFYTSVGFVQRQTQSFQGKRYQAAVTIKNGVGTTTYQGGFRCSIRANTKWENVSYLLNHPNFFSRYMESKKQADNITYTFWKGFHWPPTHSHSRILDQNIPLFNGTYVYTNEGYRRKGIWNITGTKWQYGICIIEFNRNCSDRQKEFDIYSGRYHVHVQDTDLAYRPRVFYNDLRVLSKGRWTETGGHCVDQVVRGCYNNGTCIAPNVCRCAQNWTGIDCTTPICSQTCHHHGNCTGPNECTCERGWTGFDCQIPICAQECNNGGKCIAPDVCQCQQWPNAFVDGRIAGGRPLYQDETGDPLPSGWTGFDCATPICVQAEKFLLNVPRASSKYVKMGGHGADNLLTCTDSATNLDQPRCPQFDPSTDATLDNIFVTSNDGKSFQTGCGFDPFDTGCCIYTGPTAVVCFKCDNSIVQKSNSSFFCSGSYTVIPGSINEKERFKDFLDNFKNFKLCGKFHAPRDYIVASRNANYGTAKYFKNVLTPRYSNFNFKSNLTSNRFLCNIDVWIQGDYIDDAGYGVGSGTTGVGSVWPLDVGRRARINTPNIIINSLAQTFTRGPIIRGEGVYKCKNNGSCLAPDICTCQDGFQGYDCSEPLCRHLQPTGKVTSCLNGGICTSKDSCSCVQTGSVLWTVHPDASRGITGWTGSDCTMPMCVQGFYDPFCTDLPQAPGGEGCFRCANKGNCTGPDVCTCALGWTGFDCNTPVCQVFADPLTRTQLGTVSEDNVISFESDPCALLDIYGLHGWQGRKYARGNCTKPNECTCLCRTPYNLKSCHKTAKLCDGPWQDNLVTTRNLLANRGVEYIFGTADCAFGYEGNVDVMDRFTTCHLTIYTPSSNERSSLTLIIVFAVVAFFVIVGYRYVSVRVRRRFLLAKIERRRSKRSSEESLLSAGSGAFANQ